MLLLIVIGLVHCVHESFGQPNTFLNQKKKSEPKKKKKKKKKTFFTGWLMNKNNLIYFLNPKANYSTTSLKIKNKQTNMQGTMQWQRHNTDEYS